MGGDYQKLLEDFAEAAKDEIAGIGNRQISDNANCPPHTLEMKDRIRSLMKEVASSGDCSAYKWPLLKQAFSVIIKDTALDMVKKHADFPEKSGDTPNGVICDLLELFLLFEEEAPFTLQRICEVVLEPEAYYKSSYKYLYALERLFNISPYSQ